MLKDVLFWQNSEVFPCTIGADMFKQRKVARLTQSATVTDFHQIEKTISGGSVANSIVGLSQLGNKTGFIGRGGKINTLCQAILK